MTKKTDQSKSRIEILENLMREALTKAAKKAKGDYTVAEVVEVTTRLTYQYNQVALNTQHADYLEHETPTQKAQA